MEKTNPYSQPSSSELIVTVSECIALVNQTLEFAYPTIAIEGEIAGFTINQGKYIFFDIKDNEGKLNCFMMAFQLRLPLEDGMKVRVVAAPRIHPRSGRFSLTVRAVTPVGEGSLKRAYEILKNKLDKEGLFAAERKRSLPEYPEKIGLISSEQAAGYADFRKIASQRWPLMTIETRQAKVQGDGAADDIIAAISALNELADPPEIIAIVRGGGSADDLACFNDEKLVRAIASSRVPIVAGIGHEIDETLTSLAADVAASTPSNAAELLTPDIADLHRHFSRSRVHLNESLRRILREQFSFIAHQRERLQAINLGVQEAARNYLKSSRGLLKQLDPNTVLQRGYSVVRFENQVLRDGRELQKGNNLRIETARAIIESEVQDVQSKN